MGISHHDAIDADAIEPAPGRHGRSRSQAAESLIAMRVPIGDWRDVKAEIAASAIHGLPTPDGGKDAGTPGSR